MNVRRLEPSDVALVASIDRSEHVEVQYRTTSHTAGTCTSIGPTAATRRSRTRTMSTSSTASTATPATATHYDEH